MIRFIKLLSMCLAMVAGFSAPAMACPHNNLVVNDIHNNQIRDARGNCIYTKWTEGTNKCGDQAASGNAGFGGFTQNERTIYFDFNSATLSQTAVYKLDRLLAKIKSSGMALNATVTGYADNIGGDSYNQGLSARRANAVKDYLAAHGFAGAQSLVVAAQGEKMPVTQGCEKAGGKSQTINCLQPDRRVEIRFSLAK